MANKSKIITQAQKYIAKSQWDKAVKELQKLVAEDPSDVRTLLKLGDVYSKKGDRENATRVYKQVAEAYSEQGFFLKSVAVYKQILKHDPKHLEVTLKLAELYEHLGLTSEAMTQYQAAAQIHEDKGDKKSALVVLRRMAEIDSENVASRIKLAETYSREGQRQEAITEFERAADVLKRQNRWEDFAKVAERLVYHDPDRIDVLKDLARFYLKRNESKRALAKLQQCFKSNAKDSETLTLLAQAFTDLGQTQKTIFVYRELARVYQEQGQEDRARSVLQEIAALDPNAAARSDEGRQRTTGSLPGVAPSMPAPRGTGPHGAAIPAAAGPAPSFGFGAAPRPGADFTPVPSVFPGVTGAQTGRAPTGPTMPVPVTGPTGWSPSTAGGRLSPRTPGTESWGTPLQAPATSASTSARPAFETGAGTGPLSPQPARSGSLAPTPQPPRGPSFPQAPSEPSLRGPATQSRGPRAPSVVPRPPPPAVTSRRAEPAHVDLEIVEDGLPDDDEVLVLDGHDEHPPARPQTPERPAQRPTPAPMQAPLPSAPAVPRSAQTGSADPAIARMLTETDVFIKYGLREKALSHLRRVIELEARNVAAWEKTRDVYLTMGDPSRAAEAVAELWRIHVGSGAMGAAAEARSALLKLAPSHPALAESLPEPTTRDRADRFGPVDRANEAIVHRADTGTLDVIVEPEVAEAEIDFGLGGREIEPSIDDADIQELTDSSLLAMSTREPTIADHPAEVAPLPSASDRPRPGSPSEDLDFASDRQRPGSPSEHLQFASDRPRPGSPSEDLQVASDADVIEASSIALPEALAPIPRPGGLPEIREERPLPTLSDAFDEEPSVASLFAVIDEASEAFFDALQDSEASGAPLEFAPEDELKATGRDPEIEDELDEAAFLLETELFEEARLALEDVLRRKPGNPRALQLMHVLETSKRQAPESADSSDVSDSGSLSAESAEPEESEPALDTAAGEDRYNEGMLYKEIGRLDDAIAAFRDALRAGVQTSGSLELMGHCLREKGDPLGAAKCFMEALGQGGTGEAAANLRFETGLAYEAAGDIAKAIEWFEACQREAPSHRGVSEKLAALRRSESSPGPSAPETGRPSQGPTQKKPKASYL